MPKIEKHLLNIFSSFNPHRPTLSLARGTNRQFYCTGVTIYNKLDNYFVVSADRQTFLGFEMTSNSRDTSPLMSPPVLYLVSVLLCTFRNLNTIRAIHQNLGDPVDRFVLMAKWLV